MRTRETYDLDVQRGYVDQAGDIWVYVPTRDVWAYITDSGQPTTWDARAEVPAEFGPMVELSVGATAAIRR